MKISLIAFSTFAFGTRSISAHLKANGFKIQLILFPNSYEININDQFLENLFSIVKDSDIIGISVQCYNYFEAIEITKRIKNRLKIPVLWGGIQPTVDPENCIKFADIICIGEGEEPILELVQKLNDKEPYENILNLWVNKGLKIIRNPLREICTNLDKYPFPDYDLSNHYFYRKELRKFTRFSKQDVQFHLFPSNSTQYGDFKMYNLITSRGCPHSCTYCANSMLRKIYKGKYLRKRSVDSVIREINFMKSKFPFINYISFQDDTFTMRSEEEIEEFSKNYRKKVGLPFNISSTPLTLTENKLKSLINAGLTAVRLGVQTGSDRILKEVYKRPVKNADVLKTAKLLHKYRHKLTQLCILDFIFDNPFETLDDQLQTLKLISELPRPYFILYHSLSFYPGTELLDTARKEGYIHDEINQVYNKSSRAGKFDYIRFFSSVYPLIPFWIPKRLTNFLIKKETVIFLNNPCFSKLFKILSSSFLISVYALQRMKRIFKNKPSLDELRRIPLRLQEHFFTKSVVRKF